MFRLWLCSFFFISGNVAAEFAAVAIGSKIYAIGGSNDNQGNAVKSVDVFDVDTNKWTPGPDMSTARGESYE